MKNILLIIFVAFSSISCAAQQVSSQLITEKDGKIGIGTNNPDELLTVKGIIHTQEVIVDLKGAVAPDYVFQDYSRGMSKLKPSYVRLSLEQLEAYILKNEHLPNVPSATKMLEEGISLKQMNLILLEKIEELTLYTIEQQKELQQMKLKLDQLENKI